MREITSLIQKDLNIFNYYYSESLKTTVRDFNNILEYVVSNNGKQIRPILGILISKMLGEYNSKQRDFLIAIELIHNATIFHDDVIDDAKFRRNNETLKQKYSNKIAILTGDYFLSTAIKIINSLENIEINQLFSSFMKEICEGEIEQNLTLYTVPTIDEYIDKTRRKTALLFELTTLGVSILSKIKDKRTNNILKDFGENLGILFQIKDDLDNFKEKDAKPSLNDLKEGIITAPIIFTNEEYDINLLLTSQKYDDIIVLMHKTKAIAKTQNLIEQYYNEALTFIEKLPDNEYKEKIILLLSYLRNK